MSDKEGCLWWIVGIVMFFVVIAAYALISGREQSTLTSEERARYADAGRYANESYGDYLDDKAAVEGATRVAERRIENAEQRISDLEQQVRDLDPCGGALICP